MLHAYTINSKNEILQFRKHPNKNFIMFLQQ